VAELPNWRGFDRHAAAKRILAAVNATAGYTIDVLEIAAAAQVPLPIDVPDGDVHAQAQAWRKVWVKLWNAGMCTYLPPHCDGGAERLLSYIDHILGYQHVPPLPKQHA
jgi:hypothetical protein